MTSFSVSKALERGALNLVQRWQYIASKLHLFIRILIAQVGNGDQKTIHANFNSLFLDKIDRLISLMNQSFPELGLRPEDCTEMSWVESTVYFAGFSKGSPLEVLLDTTNTNSCS